MTAYLLDTHTLLWALGAPDRLGPTATKVLEDPTQTISVSAASAWEIATKHRLGKLPEAARVLEGYAHHIAALSAAALDITAEHALLAGRLVWPHRDPFDRMLAAQTLTEGLVLVTRDPAFASLPECPTVW